MNNETNQESELEQNPESNQYSNTSDSTPTDLSPSEPNAMNNGSQAPQWQWWWQGLRAGVGLKVQALPSHVAWWNMLLIWAFASAMYLGLRRFEIEGEAAIHWPTWLATWASSTMTIGLMWLWMAKNPKNLSHPTPVAAWLALFWVAMLPLGLAMAVYAIAWSRGWLNVDGWQIGAWSVNVIWVFWGIYICQILLFLIIIWRAAQAIFVKRWVALLGSVIVMGGVTAIGWVQGNESPWYEVQSEKEDAERFEVSQEVFEAQQQLLQKQLASFTAAAQAGTADAPIQIYGLVYAPYAQDVFLKETRMVAKVMGDRLKAQPPVLSLLNHGETTGELPWATPLNLQRSLEAIAKHMNRERDILVVYMTSHGGDDHRLASQHWPLKVDDLTAEQFKKMLDQVGIKYRAVIVSACYSGGWVKPLQSPTTLVMTAADETHTSYGCGAKSDLTFFGKAFWDEQMRKTLSLQDAFKSAVPIIKAREEKEGKSDGFSNPQISAGDQFNAQWAQWLQSQNTNP